jgi:hypothetical protein
MVNSPCDPTFARLKQNPLLTSKESRKATR